MGAVEKEGPVQNARPSGKSGGGGNLPVRDFRSFKEVVGSSGNEFGVFGGPGAQPGADLRSGEKAVVIPDRVEAFKDRYGLAVVGRTVNLETLVDIDRLLNIAKVVVANVQYLGGLSLLISFHDEESMKAFLDRKNIWELWFSKLDPWKGQTLPLERVAWLKLVGIPLHVMDADVLSQVGDRFGKVIHVPKAFEEDQDLSFIRVGVLVGNSRKINDEVVLRWRNRTFRIGIEEDQEVWVPDYARRMSESVHVDSPSSEFSPVDNVQSSGEVEVGVPHTSEGLGAEEKSPEERGSGGSGSHAEGDEVHGEHGVLFCLLLSIPRWRLVGMFPLHCRGINPLLILLWGQVRWGRVSPQGSPGWASGVEWASPVAQRIFHLIFLDPKKEVDRSQMISPRGLGLLVLPRREGKQLCQNPPWQLASITI
ncbi:hypothetical protein Hdeb2414_s0012g00381331 [Helianthus debilis subsp. tardiflorus]